MTSDHFWFLKPRVSTEQTFATFITSFLCRQGLGTDWGWGVVTSELVLYLILLYYLIRKGGATAK